MGAGAELAGSLVTGEDEFAVTNSAGVACYAASTVSGAKLVTIYRKLSGYASGVHRDIARLDLDGLLKRSLSQALHRRDPVVVPLGTYEVILEPEAVAELVTWLGYTAFGAKSMQERTSFLAGRMGEQVFAPEITIYDDGHESESLRMPFDFEGSPKEKVELINHGKAAGLVYDSVYGARFGHPTTGHAMPPDEVDGPLPLNLGMAPGRRRVDEMIRACTRGLLIPRFHYVNGLLNPREALMTGLTREGTFLIEHGTLAAPVTTLRFTQSVLEALKYVRGVSEERRLVADPSQELGCAVMPTLHLAAFTFTGHSEG
jgi:predicted Zn-dependent protease